MLAENTELVRLATEAERIEGASEPRWLDAVASFHRAAPKATVVFTDLGVVAAAVLVAGADRTGAIASAVSFVAVAGLCRVYETRGALDAQGLGWYVRSVSLPI